MLNNIQKTCFVLGRRYYFSGIVFLLLFWGGVNVFAVQKDDSKEKTSSEAIVAHLTKLGYSPLLDRDKNISFQWDQKTVLIHLDKNDPEYYVVLLSPILMIDSKQDKTRIEEKAAAINDHLKVARLKVLDDQVIAYAEQFFETPDDFLSVFVRTVSTLKTAAARFEEEIEK